MSTIYEYAVVVGGVTIVMAIGAIVLGIGEPLAHAGSLTGGVLVVVVGFVGGRWRDRHDPGRSGGGGDHAGGAGD